MAILAQVVPLGIQSSRIIGRESGDYTHTCIPRPPYLLHWLSHDHYLTGYDVMCFHAPHAGSWRWRTSTGRRLTARQTERAVASSLYSWCKNSWTRAGCTLWNRGWNYSNPSWKFLFSCRCLTVVFFLLHAMCVFLNLLTYSFGSPYRVRRFLALIWFCF